MPTLVDRFGRTVTNLRISVTDRCNFRCRYCMPAEGMEWLPKESLLTFEELARVARIMVGLGVSHIRLTGGEPLMRKDLWKLVRQLRSIEGIADIALTTNGYFLQDEVDHLAAAGLHRVNISLDGVERSIVDAMARRKCFDAIWNGIEAAVRAGLNPIKLNVVLIRGVNDWEILKFARLART
ncbi:MAG: moaA 1, partial [Bacteroidetes bacterium]|nr:moaA 1 [Bacteroidota bacterium]